MQYKKILYIYKKEEKNKQLNKLNLQNIKNDPCTKNIHFLVIALVS